MQILTDTIEEIKAKNPTQTQTVEEYLVMLRRMCQGITKGQVEDACTRIKKGDHYGKGVQYLRAVMQNVMKEDSIKHKKEHDMLGSVPLPKF